MISKSVRFCGGCALKLNYYHFNTSDEGFRKSDSVEYCCKVNPAWFTCFKNDLKMTLENIRNLEK